MGKYTRLRRRAGFTLIELLVVIAIIAIIMGILLPVIFSVKEKSRQGIVFDNYRQISSALARYQLDHHKYPPVLFGYAVAGANMSGAKAAAGSHDADYFPGLYPQYINDPTVFTDPNNPVTPDKPDTWSPAPTIQSLSGGSLQTTQINSVPVNFYEADAFDASPVLSSAGMLGTTPVTRYQPAWTNITTSADPHQLAIPNAPADTFVTCTTYHAGSGIGQGKVLVLV